jgi:hypothetical protein
MFIVVVGTPSTVGTGTSMWAWKVAPARQGSSVKLCRRQAVGSLHHLYADGQAVSTDFFYGFRVLIFICLLSLKYFNMFIY